MKENKTKTNKTYRRTVIFIVCFALFVALMFALFFSCDGNGSIEEETEESTAETTTETETTTSAGKEETILEQNVIAVPKTETSDLLSLVKNTGKTVYYAIGIPEGMYEDTMGRYLAETDLIKQKLGISAFQAGLAVYYTGKDFNSVFDAELLIENLVYENKPGILPNTLYSDVNKIEEGVTLYSFYCSEKENNDYIYKVYSFYVSEPDKTIICYSLELTDVSALRREDTTYIVRKISESMVLYSESYTVELDQSLVNRSFPLSNRVPYGYVVMGVAPYDKDSAAIVLAKTDGSRCTEWWIGFLDLKTSNLAGVWKELCSGVDTTTELYFGTSRDGIAVVCGNSKFFNVSGEAANAFVAPLSSYKENHEVASADGYWYAYTDPASNLVLENLFTGTKKTVYAAFNVGATGGSSARAFAFTSDNKLIYTIVGTNHPIGYGIYDVATEINTAVKNGMTPCAANDGALYLKQETDGKSTGVSFVYLDKPEEVNVLYSPDGSHKAGFIDTYADVLSQSSFSVTGDCGYYVLVPSTNNVRLMIYSAQSNKQIYSTAIPNMQSYIVFEDYVLIYTFGYGVIYVIELPEPSFNYTAHIKSGGDMPAIEFGKDKIYSLLDSADRLADYIDYSAASGADIKNDIIYYIFDYAAETGAAAISGSGTGAYTLDYQTALNLGKSLFGLEDNYFVVYAAGYVFKEGCSYNFSKNSFTFTLPALAGVNRSLERENTIVYIEGTTVRLNTVISAPASPSRVNAVYTFEYKDGRFDFARSEVSSEPAYDNNEVINILGAAYAGRWLTVIEEGRTFYIESHPSVSGTETVTQSEITQGIYVSDAYIYGDVAYMNVCKNGVWDVLEYNITDKVSRWLSGKDFNSLYSEVNGALKGVPFYAAYIHGASPDGSRLVLRCSDRAGSRSGKYYIYNCVKGIKTYICDSLTTEDVPLWAEEYFEWKDRDTLYISVCAPGFAAGKMDSFKAVYSGGIWVVDEISSSLGSGGKDPSETTSGGGGPAESENTSEDETDTETAPGTDTETGIETTYGYEIPSEA